MSRNPLIRSSFTLYVLWYWIAGLALVALGRANLHDVLSAFAVSLALTAGGALVGLYMTLGTEAVLMHARSREVRAGHSHRGAHLSLGKLPGGDAAASDPNTKE